MWIDNKLFESSAVFKPEIQEILGFEHKLYHLSTAKLKIALSKYGREFGITDDINIDNCSIFFKKVEKYILK